MVGRRTRPTGPLLKLFLSPSTIHMKEAIFQANFAHPKHGGDRPLNGGLVAVEPTPLGRKLLLLTLTKVQGPKLGLPQGVIALDSHEASPLRDVVFLFDSDSLPHCAIGARNRTGELQPCVLGHATVNSLGILGQGGEGIKGIAAHMVPEGEALCLREGPNFHVGFRQDSA